MKLQTKIRNWNYKIELQIKQAVAAGSGVARAVPRPAAVLLLRDRQQPRAHAGVEFRRALHA